MKARRRLRIVLVVVAVMAVVGLLACTPAVQTGLVRIFLPSGPDLTVEVGRVKVRSGSVRVSGVEVRRPGLKLTLPEADLRLPLTGLLRGRAEIERLQAIGWTVELDPEAAAAAPAAKEPAGSIPFTGFLDALRLPVSLSADGVRLEGDVKVAGARPLAAHMKINADGIRPAAEGKVLFHADVQPSAQEGVERLEAEGALTLALAGDGRSPERLAVDVTLTGKGSAFVDDAALSAGLSVARAAGGEDLVVRAGLTGRDLVSLTAHYEPSARALTADWKLDVKRADIARYALGRPLPAFEITGEGKLANTPGDTRAGRLEGRLQVTADELGAVDPRLATVGALKTDATFAGALQGDDFVVETCAVTVSGESPVAEVELSKPFRWSLKEGRPAADDGGVLTLTLKGVPLAWVEPFCAGLRLVGEPVTGAFSVSGKGGVLRVATAAPLTLRDFSVSRDGAALLQNATFVADEVSVERLDGRLSAKVGRVSLKSSARDLLAMAVTAELRPDGSATATAEGTLRPSALATQPALASLPAVNGEAAFTLSAETGKSGWNGRALLVAEKLATPTGNTLPGVRIEATASGGADGAVEADVPVTITAAAGRTSDLRLKARVERTGDASALTAGVTSKVIFIDDVKALAAGFSREEPAGPSAPPAPKPAEGPPAWAALPGVITLDLDRVVYAEGAELADVTGRIVLTKDAVKVESLLAKSGEGELSIVGGLRQSGAGAPYEMTADINATGIEVGPWLKAAAPGKPAPVEGRFDLQAKASGVGATPQAVAKAVDGTLRLKGVAGKLRVLGVDADSLTRKTATVAGIAGIIGAATGDERTVRYAERVAAASDLARRLQVMAFDELSLAASFSPAAGVKVSDLRMLSPQVRLTGGGSTRPRAGLSIWRQPFTAELQLSARGDFAKGWEALGLLKADAVDAAGYAPLNEPLKLDGTLLQIGTGQVLNLMIRTFGR